MEAKPEFRELMNDIRANFDSKQYTPAARESIVMSLNNLGIKDELIFSKTAELLQQKRFPHVNAVTNLLYALAKSGYKHADTLWLAAALDTILSEPKLDTYTACRNLWNLQALDYKSDVALSRFAETIVAADVNKLNEVDIANSL